MDGECPRGRRGGDPLVEVVLGVDLAAASVGRLEVELAELRREMIIERTHRAARAEDREPFLQPTQTGAGSPGPGNTDEERVAGESRQVPRQVDGADVLARLP